MLSAEFLRFVLGIQPEKTLPFLFQSLKRLQKHSIGGKVLYLNTAHSGRQLATEIRKKIWSDYSAKNPDPRITYMHCPSGTLNGLEKDIRMQLANGVRFIIINSLEFSSKDYRRKDDLLFQIKTWAHEFSAAVIVFAEQVKSIANQGKIQRGGGVGKFAGAAAVIVYLSAALTADADEDLEDEDITGDEWLSDERAKQRERVMAAAKSIKEMEEEEELLERAKVLAREQVFLDADVPVWKAEDETEEAIIINLFLDNNWEFDQKDNESDEHYNKRMMAAIAVDVEACSKEYALVIKAPFHIVHSNNPDVRFAEELLPTGADYHDYYDPDKLPIPGERKPRLMKKEERARELLM